MLSCNIKKSELLVVCFYGWERKHYYIAAFLHKDAYWIWGLKSHTWQFHCYQWWVQLKQHKGPLLSKTRISYVLKAIADRKLLALLWNRNFKEREKGFWQIAFYKNYQSKEEKLFRLQFTSFNEIIWLCQIFSMQKPKFTNNQKSIFWKT